MIRAHIIVRGRVQGVFYRASAQREGARLGLHGWVRNRHDGAVEAVAEGPADDVRAFVEWCRQGPPLARVRELELTEDEPAGLAEGFLIRPTA